MCQSHFIASGQSCSIGLIYRPRALGSTQFLGATSVVRLTKIVACASLYLVGGRGSSKITVRTERNYELVIANTDNPDKHNKKPFERATNGTVYNDTLVWR